MRAAEVGDRGHGQEPPIGPDGTDAWTAVLSLHGADDDWDDDWDDHGRDDEAGQGRDPDTVAAPSGRRGEGDAVTAVELKNGVAITDSRIRTEPGPHPAS